MFLNLTKETCTGTGNTLTLAGATAGMNAFGKTGNGVDGALYSCVVDDADGTTHVAGIYTFNKIANTLTRNDTWNTTATTVDNNPATNIALSAGTHTVRCDVAKENIYQASIKDLIPVTSYRASVPHNITTQNNAIAFIANRLNSVKVRFYHSITITSLVDFITTADAAALHYRRGIYEADINGQFGSLLLDSGNINATLGTTGVKITTLPTPIRLDPGTYYFVATTDSTIARVRAPSYTATAGSNSSYFDNGNTRFDYVDNVSGALPATLTVTNSNISSSAPVGFQ